MTLPKPSLALCICRNANCDIPFGLCHCRCGGLAPIASRNDYRDGLLQGHPKQFILHHQCKPAAPEWLEPFNLEGSQCRLIPLTRGFFAVVDVEDYARVAVRSWCVWNDKKGHIYGCTRLRLRDGGPKTIFIHRFIIEPPDKLEVDHKNGNGLDNRRSNMRLATPAQNRQNARRQKPSQTGLRGVFPATGGGFSVQISVNGVLKYLGHFKNPLDGYVVYCAAAAEYHGEFARFD